MSYKSITAMLNEISFFLDVSGQDLDEIASITTEHDYRAGDVIIEENSMGDAFFIIYKGKVEILKKFEDGDEVVLGVYSDGEFFGEMSILDEGPRSASARAVEPATILKVSYKDFERVLSVAPQISYAIMKELSTRLRQTGALLVWQLNRKNRELEDAALETVRSVVRLLEQRDGIFEGHSQRVADLSVRIGRELGLDDQQLKYLELGGLLHDIGMINVSGTLVSKQEPLSVPELEKIRKHTKNSREILGHIPYLKPAIPCVLYHHERFDGSGYPEGLSGNLIPPEGRIVAIAEVFDALTSSRPYRESLTADKAAEHIKLQSGKDFDPVTVEAFLRITSL